jgi:hypothetical protein
LKLFSEEWEEEYDREVAAYALMVHRKVKRCIPHVYWKGAKSLSEWNGKDGDATGDEIWYGIAMEYFEDFRELQFEKIDAVTAEAVARALNRIHEARIRHGDMQEQNILLVRENGVVRAVWIDFSCAEINAYAEILDSEWESLMVEFELKAVQIPFFLIDFIRIPISLLIRFLQNSTKYANLAFVTTGLNLLNQGIRRFLILPTTTILALFE